MSKVRDSSKRPKRSANQARRGALQYDKPKGKNIDLESSPNARVNPRTIRYKTSRKPGRNPKGQAGSITPKTKSKTQARTQARKVMTNKRHRKHASQKRRSDTPRDKQTRRHGNQRKEEKGQGKKYHQPEEGTKSPAKPDEPLTEPGERRRTARAFSL